MENIRDKYARLRPQIKNGSIILVRGRRILPRIIEWADKAYYSHALVVFKMGDRLLAIQSMADGVGPSFLSTEVFANIDFCILNPVIGQVSQARVNRCVETVFNKAESGIPYDIAELPKILLREKLGINIKNIQGNPKQNICSVFAGITYGGLLPLKCYRSPFTRKGYLTPQDLIRYALPQEISIVGNDSINAIFNLKN